ncbi:hypothetical protein BLOT_007749 [Blomia tropicalis]|nr:hypothetical protein BLOT_007749 [Blomia tropicalis]
MLYKAGCKFGSPVHECGRADVLLPVHSCIIQADNCIRFHSTTIKAGATERFVAVDPRHNIHHPSIHPSTKCKGPRQCSLSCLIFKLQSWIWDKFVEHPNFYLSELVAKIKLTSSYIACTDIYPFKYY